MLITSRVLKIIDAPAGTLFEVAARELGDPLQWTRIARLNGISDPFLSQPMTLKIPPLDPAYNDGGILV